MTARGGHRSFPRGKGKTSTPEREREVVPLRIIAEGALRGKESERAYDAGGGGRIRYPLGEEEGAREKIPWGTS